eukprot:scaffold65043_cov87-Cyclotella_meneghiniana.AAC.1
MSPRLERHTPADSPTSNPRVKQSETISLRATGSQPATLQCTPADSPTSNLRVKQSETISLRATGS